VPGQGAGLAEEAGVGPHGGCPSVLEAGVLHPPEHVDAPHLLPAFLVAEALEGDADLHLVAVVHQAAARLEHVVGVEVHRAVERVDAREAAAGGGAAAGAAAELVAAGAVLLHAEGVDAEQEGQAPVVVGVEQDLDVILGCDVVPVGPGGAHHVAVQFAGPDAEVDGVGGVPDQHLGGLGGGPPVHGLVLGEVGEARGPGPHRLVEHAVDGDGRLDPGDADLDPVLPAAEHEGGVLQRDEREEGGQEHAPGNVTASRPAPAGGLHPAFRNRW
jgi:hypothetical protein